MATTDYHRRQANVLQKLAETTRDTETARELRRIAAQHIAAADEIDATGHTEHDKK